MVFCQPGGVLLGEKMNRLSGFIFCVTDVCLSGEVMFRPCHRVEFYNSSELGKFVFCYDCKWSFTR